MSVSGGVATVPGWYGKLPSLGDFASRRLEADFIEPWDLWLGEGLQAQRETFGEQWLEAYLHSPPWRFVLAPGAMPGQEPGRVIAGVLLPSVDRVGRHFPLTIAATFERMPRIAAEFDAMLAWMHRLEDTALDAVQGGWGIDDLEEALSALSPPDDANPSSADDRLGGVRRAVDQAVRSRGGFVDIAALASRAELAAVFAGEPTAAEAGARLPMPSMHGTAIWLADPPGQPQLLVSAGLPGRDAFVRMFGGGGATGPKSTPASAAGQASPAAAFASASFPASPVDDPLATLPQSLGPPIGTIGPSGAAHDDDLLRMFDVTPSAAGSADASPLPDDDILALFGATEAPAEPRPMPEGSSDEPDILALFGVPPADPDPGKTQ
jgi:type VI secretion system protein ImpM